MFHNNNIKDLEITVSISPDHFILFKLFKFILYI